MFSKNLKQLLLLLAAVVIAGAVIFVFYTSGSEQAVTLSASTDKQSYTAGEGINLALELSNTGEVETCISDRDAGSIVFNSFTRDGEEVETRSVSANYIAPFPKLLEVSLKPVDPGEDLDITLSSENDPGLDALALSTTALEDDTGIVTFYNVEEPGQYALDLAYKYPGPESPECERVFKESSNNVEVTFTVTR